MSCFTVLKKEHKLIMKMLEKINNFNIEKDKRKTFFSTSKEFLLAHLQKEDKLLYSTLKKISEKDLKTKSILNMFTNNIEEIKSYVIDFYEKYKDKDFDNDFYKDLGEFTAEISHRIIVEENILFKKCEELFNNKIINQIECR